MQIEYKFRVYDRKLKTINGVTPALAMQLLYDSKNYEVLMYTGLKDCNGEEIYEGDRLEYPSDQAFPELKSDSDTPYYSTVIWNHGFFLESDGYLEPIHDSAENGKLPDRIIGNIYDSIRH